jgi:hypothetical protein
MWVFCFVSVSPFTSSHLIFTGRSISPSQWQGHRQIEGTNVTTTQVSGMNGFAGGTTDSGAISRMTVVPGSVLLSMNL